MGRHKSKKGICRLCGDETTLSFEHIPPKVAFNKNTKYLSVPMEEYAKVKNPLEDKIKGKQKQGGVGHNSLCRKCNSFLGSNYVDAYKKWVYGGMQVITQYDYPFNKYTLNDQEPLKVLKQIISMFISINRPFYLKSYPELAEFVKNPESNNLPKRYRVFSYLNEKGGMRYMHHNVASIPNVGIVTCSEITYPPYGYVLLFDFEKDLNILTEITYFKDFLLSEITSIEMEMYKLPTYSQWPLDYRSKAQYKKAIENGIKQTEGE